MNSFQHIIKIFLNYEKNIFDNYEKINKVDSTQHFFNILFGLFLNTKNNLDIKLKYEIFGGVLNNIFISEQIKNEYINIFCKIQNIYFSFIKFKNQYKYKKYKILIDKDLLLNPICKDSKYCIHIMQNKCKYLFSLNDIINLFKNSLTNSCHLFLELYPIKNPYNNLIFNKSTLYNMYFFIKEKTISNIELIDKFFLCNFDFNNFREEYKYMARDYVIKIHIKNSTNEQFKDMLDDMIISFNNKYKKNKGIHIHEEFPITDLRIIMKDYIYLYMTSLYSFIEYKRTKARIKLHEKLTKFYNYNPLFGRKYLKIKKDYCEEFGKFKHKIETNFNKKYINFNDKSDKWLNNTNNVFYSVINNNEHNRYLNSVNDIEYNNENRELYLLIHEIDNTFINTPNYEINRNSDFNNNENTDDGNYLFSSDEESITGEINDIYLNDEETDDDNDDDTTDNYDDNDNDNDNNNNNDDDDDDNN